MSNQKTTKVQKFTKVKEELIHFKSWSFLLMRQLESNNNLSDLSQDEILYEVMKSDFHIRKWKNIADENSESNTYGYYDNDKLISSDYLSLDYNHFKIKFLSFVTEWNNAEPSFTEKIELLISKNISTNSFFFYLDPDDSKIAEFHTYSFFCGFVIIDRIKNLVTLIEFGQD